MTAATPASERAVPSRSAPRAILGSIGYVVLAFLVAGVLGLTLFIAFFAVAFAVADPEAFIETVLTDWLVVIIAADVIFLGIATLSLALLSFRYDWVPRRSIGFATPTGRQLAIAAALAVLLVPLAAGLEFLFELAGFSASEHAIFDAEIPPVQYFGLAVVAILLIGPVEELLFRGLIQNYVRPAMGSAGAVVWTSLLFALAHVQVYFVVGATAAVMSLVIVFVISLVLGGLYEKQRNIYAVMLVHGLYDAVLFTIEGLRLSGAFG